MIFGAVEKIQRFAEKEVGEHVVNTEGIHVDHVHGPGESLADLMYELVDMTPNHWRLKSQCMFGQGRSKRTAHSRVFLIRVWDGRVWVRHLVPDEFGKTLVLLHAVLCRLHRTEDILPRSLVRIADIIGTDPDHMSILIMQCPDPLDLTSA